jgi:hypothetical protein
MTNSMYTTRPPTPGNSETSSNNSTPDSSVTQVGQVVDTLEALAGQ